MIITKANQHKYFQGNRSNGINNKQKWSRATRLIADATHSDCTGCRARQRRRFQPSEFTYLQAHVKPQRNLDTDRPSRRVALRAPSPACAPFLIAPAAAVGAARLFCYTMLMMKMANDDADDNSDVPLPGKVSGALSLAPVSRSNTCAQTASGVR